MDSRHPVSTRILTCSDIAALMTPAHYLVAVEDGFTALAQGAATVPPPLHVATEEGGFHAKGASLTLSDGRCLVAVKINGNFPGNPKLHGLPTIQGAIALSDGRNGRLLALMDSIEVTARRTAAATALALRRLAKADASSLAIIGCGRQAFAQFEAVAAVRPLDMVRLFDLDAMSARRLAEQIRAAAKIETEIAETPRDAARASAIVVTCTTSGMPLLGPKDVGPGCFIAAVGADAPHKNEIHPDLMARAFVLVDSLDQCLAMGDLRHAVAAGAMTADRVACDLAQLAAGRPLERPRDDDIVIFDSTGMAIQDVAAAAMIHDRAVQAGRGIEVLLSA